MVSNKNIFKWFFAYLCLICIIGKSSKFIKNPVIYDKKQFWPFDEISIFSNGGHLGWRAWLLDIPKDDSGQVCFKLAQWFQRRRFLKKLTDGRRTPSDGNSSHRWAKKQNQKKTLLLPKLYLKARVLLPCLKHLHHRIISLKEQVWDQQSRFFNSNSFDWSACTKTEKRSSCIFVIGVLAFGTVLTVWYFVLFNCIALFCELRYKQDYVLAVKCSHMWIIVGITNSTLWTFICIHYNKLK